MLVSPTYKSGCSQEHTDLKKIKKKLYLSWIRETLNHKIRNALKFLKKKLFVKLSSKKKKKPKKIELKSEK